MRARLLLQTVAFLACASCASQSSELATLRARVDTLEAEVTRLAASAPCPPRLDGATGFPNPVPVEIGAAEFYDGDLVTVEEVRGTHPTLASGGTYLVRGRYHLNSTSSATLLLSVTASAQDKQERNAPEARLIIERGDGRFSLITHIGSRGYPHLTFYGVDGRPFGGIYFGTGDSLLLKKSWRYREQ